MQVFLTSIDGEVPVVKVGDFGLSYELIDRSKASTRAGTMIYVFSRFPHPISGLLKYIPGNYQENPQVNVHFPFFNLKIFLKDLLRIDVYAVGCILLELCLGSHRPASGLILPHIRDSLLKDLQKGFPRIFSIVIDAVALQPENRLTFGQILKKHFQ